MKIILGISAGIAAYKTPQLVRELLAAGDHQVQVVMTQAAEQFVTPLTLQTVSQRPVRKALFDPASEAAMDHIELARWADHILIAPTTAHLIAQLAQGLAPDLLTTLCLATTAPITLAPAMNQQMWRHPATQANCEILKSRGVRFIGPASGEQACGQVGLGRMAEPVEIVTALLKPSSQTC